jgi:hypothetical protein
MTQSIVHSKMTLMYGMTLPKNYTATNLKHTHAKSHDLHETFRVYKETCIYSNLCAPQSLYRPANGKHSDKQNVQYFLQGTIVISKAIGYGCAFRYLQLSK